MLVHQSRKTSIKIAKTEKVSESMASYEILASQGLRRLREASETLAILSERIEDSDTYPFANTETASLLREASQIKMCQ